MSKKFGFAQFSLDGNTELSNWVLCAVLVFWVVFYRLK